MDYIILLTGADVDISWCLHYPAWWPHPGAQAEVEDLGAAAVSRGYVLIDNSGSYLDVAVS